MKAIVIGRSTIGSGVAAKLTELGHEAVSVDPTVEVSIRTGEGLGRLLSGVDVVVDVSESPTFGDAGVMEFLSTTTGNLLRAEKEATVGHHVVLSVSGVERMRRSSYFRAKRAQEALVKASGVPYSIVQFFVPTKGNVVTENCEAVHLSNIEIQPVYANHVASAVAHTADGGAVNGIVDVASQQRFQLDS
ncbi:SDR family oxidoreductase [Streptomyces sp. NPDC060187]|uniref:SDR family oxidoreductase n=1 Tax=Streptomyces sp. NPDC060187 TaxID=3347067 RepID=UPI00364B0E33